MKRRPRVVWSAVRLALALLLAGVPLDAQLGPAAEEASAPRMRHGSSPEVELAELEAAHPELLSVRSIGRSTEGRELWLATLGRRSTPRAEGEAPGPAPELIPLEERPGLFVLDALHGGSPTGGAVALAFVRHLVEGVERDPAIAHLLRTRTLYVAPDLDPDRRARLAESGDAELDELGAGQTLFARNFPAGWQPPSVLPGGGPYPLCLPEARAVAAFLLGRPNLVLVHSLEAVAPAAATTAEAAQTALAELARSPEWAAQPGGVLAFCRQELGLYTTRTGVPIEAGDGQAGAHDGLVRWYVALAHILPAIELSVVAVEPLEPGLWQLDLAVHNRGLLSTSGPRGGSGAGEAGARLEIEGLELLAVARGGGEAEVYRLLPGAPSSLELGHLSGGESASLRLVLTGAPGQVLRLQVLAPRAGRDGAQLVMP